MDFVLRGAIFGGISDIAWEPSISGFQWELAFLLLAGMYWNTNSHCFPLIELKPD
jgi:hypothetical protein